jgi:predicted Fe-Mo cluster-binding NifX family protein
MKIAIPLIDGRLTPHFGRCEEVVIVEADFEKRRIVAKKHLKPPPHAPGVLPRWLGEQGAEVIIAGGMGHRAREIFAENGVYVVVGASSKTPEELVTDYLDGILPDGENRCDHDSRTPGSSRSGCKHRWAEHRGPTLW